ncbi:aerobic respiration control sensor protein ArcB [Rhabdaerophilaceae bacterium]
MQEAGSITRSRMTIRTAPHKSGVFRAGLPINAAGNAERVGRATPYVVTLSIIGLIWAVLIVNIRQNAEHDYTNAIRRASTLSRALEQEFLRTVGTIDQTLLYVRDSYVRDPLNFRFEDWQQSGRFLSTAAFQIGMTGPDGMLLTSNLSSSTPVSLADREHIKVHLQGKKDELFISKPVMGRVSKKWAIQLSRRMEFPDGRLAGVVVASIDPHVIATFHTSVIIGDKGNISIVGDDGVVRVRSPFRDEGIGRDLSNNKAWAVHLAKKSEVEYSYESVSSLDDVSRLFHSRRIAGTTMRISIGQSLAEVYEHSSAERKWNIVAGCVATLWLLGLLLVSLRYQQRLAEARDRSEAGTRAKSEFLASMSHEIRTPLNGVIGLAELLGSTKLNSEQTGLVQTLQNSASHLLRILNDVLDLSRLEAGKVEIEYSTFELRDLTEGVLQLLGSAASVKGLALGAEIDPALPKAFRGDIARIRQILFNLVSNGIKFTDTGSVTLAIDAGPSHDAQNTVIRFRVEDTGCGIPANAIPKLFQDFSQVDASVSRRYGGTGLGLAISRRLANRMGGTIDVFSVEGIGSRFELTLPLERASIEPKQAEPSPEDAQDATVKLRSFRVLVAEDNKTNRFVVTQQLRLLGQSVETAIDGAEAVEKLKSTPYDLILMDMMMPIVDGLAATRAIRQLPEPLCDTRIIALTANSSMDDQKACAEAGMDGFLSKPLTRNTLADLLEAETSHFYANARKPSEQPQPIAEAPPIRLQTPNAVLEGLSADLGEDGVREIFDMFTAECLDQLAQMRTLLDASDRGELRRIAHSIKGSAAGLGFERLVDSARNLEMQALLAEPKQLQADFAAVEAEFMSVRFALDAA